MSAKMNINVASWKSWANIVRKPYDGGPTWNYAFYSWGLVRYSNFGEGYWSHTTAGGQKILSVQIHGFSKVVKTLTLSFGIVVP